jgi:stress response protein YsnF
MPSNSSNMMKISKKEWDKTHKDYKTIINGQPYKMVYDDGRDATILVPVIIEGITPAEIGGMGPITLPTETEVGSGDIPAGRKSDEDEEDEKQLKEKMEGLYKSFESFIQEAKDMNDPILIKLRAAQMKRDAKKNEPSKKEISPANAKKLAKLHDERAQIMRDMEQEAEIEGGPIADRYGKMLNKIDKEIAKLGGHGEWGPEDNVYMSKAEIERRARSIRESEDVNEAKFKAGQVWVWKHVDGDKEVEITDIRSNGDVIGRVKGTSDEFIVRDANKYLKNKISESMINEKAEVTIPGYNVSNSVIKKLEREFEDMLPAGTMFAIINNRGDKRVQIQTTTGKALYPFSGGLKGGIQQPVIVDKKMMQRALDFIDKYSKHRLGESMVNEDWGSSDQAAMNKAIHKDLGNPKKMMSPFDPKLRSAAEDAVDFWWDEWEEYKNDRDGLIDNAVRSYMRAYFPKEFAMMVKMFESYDGNMSDFKYEFPEQFEEATGNSSNAIKKIAKKGKGYEVRTSTYMSEPEMKKVGDAMGLELVSYEKSTNVAVTVYEHKLSDFAGYTNGVKLDEGFFSNISIMIQNAKDQNEFIKDFFKEYGKEVKKTAETLKWVADMYTDDVYANDDYEFIYKESVDTINEDWGTFDTPEGKMVAKDLDKAWNTFAKTVDAAHKEWLKTVQKYRGEAGKGSGFRDSEGRDAVISAMEWYLEKVFMTDNRFGGIDYKKYRTLLGESVEIEEVDEARSINKIQKEWTKVVDMMKAKVDSWKSAEGAAKDKILGELKTLTAQKKKLEAELNDAVSLKDIDAELAESLDEAKAWDKLNKIADKKYGEFGFATLDDDQMARHIDMEAANKLAEEKYGEFGFATLSEDEMESLINNNPKLVK